MCVYIFTHTYIYIYIHLINRPAWSKARCRPHRSGQCCAAGRRSSSWGWGSSGPTTGPCNPGSRSGPPSTCPKKRRFYGLTGFNGGEGSGALEGTLRVKG